MNDHDERPDGPGMEGDDSTKKRGGGRRDPEGQDRSHGDAVKDGFGSRFCRPEQLAAAVADRTAELIEQFQPGSPYETWLVGEMGVAMARIDRCKELSFADLHRCVEQAGISWDHDRRMAVEDLA